MPSPEGQVDFSLTVGQGKRRMRGGVQPDIGKSLVQLNNFSFSARIPHQSPPGGGASFPPGEAIAPAAPLHFSTDFFRGFRQQDPFGLLHDSALQNLGGVVGFDVHRLLGDDLAAVGDLVDEVNRGTRDLHAVF